MKMLLNSNTRTRFILIQLIFLLIIISCDKKYDLIEQTQFIEPYPINGATNVPLKHLSIGFKNVIDKRQIEKFFLDTINPPKFEMDLIGQAIPSLLPDKDYYWYIIIKNNSGYNESDIQTFRTVSFDCHWKLDSIKSSANSPAILLNDNQIDSFLLADYDLLEFQIDKENAKISLYKNSNGYRICKFSYPQSIDSIKFIDTTDNSEYNFKLNNIGYFDYCNDIQLVLVNSKYQTLFYSKF